jgi:hypothetical protein
MLPNSNYKGYAKVNWHTSKIEKIKTYSLAYETN